MRNLFVPLIAAALATVMTNTAATAATYELVNFPFSYSGGATSTNATLTTSFIGTLNDPAAIEALLNSTQYSATLYNASGALRALDNSNSHWELNFSYGSTPSVTLGVSSTAILLSFSTIAEYSGAALLLRSSDNLSILQYRQENNVTNYNFVDFEFNAIFDANYQMPYGSTFVLSAVPVDEPAIPTLMTLGILLLGLARKVRRDA